MYCGFSPRSRISCLTALIALCRASAMTALLIVCAWAGVGVCCSMRVASTIGSAPWLGSEPARLPQVPRRLAFILSEIDRRLKLIRQRGALFVWSRRRADHSLFGHRQMSAAQHVLKRLPLASGGTPKIHRLDRASPAPQIFLEIPQRACKPGAMLIAIEGLALSLDGCLSRILIMHWDREWTKLELAEGLSQ